MAGGQESLQEYILSLLDAGQGREQVELKLLDEGYDEKFAKEMVKEIMKLRQSKRMVQGLVLILGGALICLLSCVITMTMSLSATSFAWVLYGLTSVGILLVFIGFMKIF